MGLENYIHKAADNIKLNHTTNKGKISDYLIKYDLKDYFSENLSEDERAKLKGDLEEKVGKSLVKYGDELRGLGRKTAAKGTMALAAINDLSAYLTRIPIPNVTGLGIALFGLKSLVEAPAMHRYLKKSNDWYGALKHYAMKPAHYLIPVIGAGLEAGSFERMVKNKAIKEAKISFLKEAQKYESLDKRLKVKLQTPLSEAAQVEDLPLAA